MSVTDYEKCVFVLGGIAERTDPWPILQEAKRLVPELRATCLFIPGLCSPEMLDRYREASWIELGLHGYHGASYECALWDAEEAHARLAPLAEGFTCFAPTSWATSEQLQEVVAELGLVGVEDGTTTDFWSPKPLRRHVINGTPMNSTIYAISRNNNWLPYVQEVAEPFALVSEAAVEVAPDDVVVKEFEADDG